MSRALAPYGLRNETVAAWAGLRAVLRTPRWIDHPNLARLMSDESRQSTNVDARVVERAGKFALWFTRQFSKVPGGRWKNTCLYRVVAECLARRGFGERVIVHLGVRTAPDDAIGFVAHAWLTAADGTVVSRMDEGEGFEALRHSTAGP